MSETNSANFLIYFRMNEHRRPVALFEGELHCSPTETYKRFECESQLYPQKQFPEINSSLEVCVIMNELQNQHRKFILKHSNLSTIVITGLETQCHVFGLRKPYFSFNLGSIKIAGYLVVRDRQQNGSNQLVSGQGEVVIKNGSAILYIDDYFAILTINSENAEHEIVQSFNKEKEFKSISLMNCNKRRQSTSNVEMKVIYYVKKYRKSKITNRFICGYIESSNINQSSIQIKAIESLESFVGNITEQIDDSLKQLPVIEVSPDTDNVIEDSFRLSQLNQITLILTKDSPSASLKLFANRGIGYELSLQSNDSICLTMNGKLLNINQILNQSKPLTIEYFLEKWANRSNRNEWSNDATISGKIIISIHNGTLSVLILAPELFILFDPREVNGESNSVDSILKFYCHRNGSEQLVIDPIVRSLNASTTTGTLDTTNETVTTNEKDKQEKDGLHTKLKSDGNSNNLKSNKKKKKKKKSRTKEKKKQHTHKYKPKLCKTSLTNFKFFKTGKYDGIHLDIKADRSKPKIISKPKECIQTDPYCGIDITSFGHESSTAKSPILANIIAERATYLFYYEEKTKRTPFGLFDGELERK
ncbi:hypothetical protein RDWZM_006556 [Blomia tropicalis]|uniref:Uncharacterized protein n=1 Tax=Blomia tropicalis TaxID=40697 RepID=A0A9Q0M8H3_BLOTA|nr:hypothetical protein RDWZM_006556 [Blomia tropicalis]